MIASQRVSPFQERDVAVFHGPVEFSDHVHTICLPGRRGFAHTPVGDEHKSLRAMRNLIYFAYFAIAALLGCCSTVQKMYTLRERRDATRAALKQLAVCNAAATGSREIVKLAERRAAQPGTVLIDCAYIKRVEHGNDARRQFIYAQRER